MKYRWQCKYVEVICLVFPRKNVENMGKQFNEDFTSMCNGFVENKLSTHLGEDKIKSIFFTSRCRIKSLLNLCLFYNNIQIKQNSLFKNLGRLERQVFKTKYVQRDDTASFNTLIKPITSFWCL